LIILDELEQLIKGCVAGHRYAQNKLYALYSPKMFPICLRYSKNREEAEETMQEGFLKVFNHLYQYKSLGFFEGWVRKIMVNTALEKYRSQSCFYQVISVDNIPEKKNSTEDILQQINTKELIVMIQKLPPTYRMVFNLHVFEGMKHREIAKQLGVTEGTSKSNLADARKILQRLVNESLHVAKKEIN
jgi:RNA polymerase sigma factor (sigma-70 family)